ncbi:hypothetical protein [Hyphomicrobium sp. CS1GBMeth3]|uniref:hypothetical protein n=1 Tax=Hyphomicrobium sp. CS1GBMeth3 TaxID=1892845 RepID=UPI0009303DEA|nr:hypothetical protein [Hyphomicrobium sp. CS1GBMeth3]
MIGHNGPPPDEKLTPAGKVERIKALLDRADLTAQQKCVGAKIIAEADRDGVAEVRTPELQRAASVRDRETIFKATRALKVADITKQSGLGQSGKFSVLPQHVVDEIVHALDAARTGRAGTDRSQNESGRAGPDRSTYRQPVGSDPTGPTEPDQLLASRAPARVNRLPSEVVISKLESPPTPSHVQPVTDWRSAFGADDDPDVRFVGGKLTLLNGTRLAWIERFGGDEVALDLALIEAAGSIQRSSNSGLKLQVERKLAGIVRDARDRDRRYNAAVERNSRGNSQGGTKEGSTARTMRLAREAAERSNAGGRQ